MTTVSASLGTRNTSLIEVYADIWCPFAHVGLRSILERRREKGPGDSIFIVRPWPLELVNGAPLDPSTTAEHVHELRDQIAPELFSHFDPDHFPTTTIPALALVVASYRKDVRLGESVSFALRDALFEQGRDISRPKELTTIATKYGVDPIPADYDGVLEQWHAGQLRGVKGSPHFFCAGAEVFCPSLSIVNDAEGRLQIGRNREALDAFLRQCLGC